MSPAVILAVLLASSPPSLGMVVARARTCAAALEPDAAELRAVAYLEAEAGVPAQARGLALAAACVESGFRDGARGDCDGRAPGDHCRAWGWFQFHGWAGRLIDRDDALASARLWLDRVRERLHHPWVERCRPTSELDRWRLAHVLAVRAPGRARCGAVPLAWKVLARWSSALPEVAGGEPW